MAHTKYLVTTSPLAIDVVGVHGNRQAALEQRILIEATDPTIIAHVLEVEVRSDGRAKFVEIIDR